jgi:carboxypeptidase C (cathepsin A)
MVHVLSSCCVHLWLLQAYNSTTTPSRIGYLEYKAMEKIAVPACIALIRKCNEGKIEAACTAAFATCNLSLVNPVLMGGWNQYDLRVKCAKPPLCYDFS